jgi:hypothetical protein
MRFEGSKARIQSMSRRQNHTSWPPFHHLRGRSIAAMPSAQYGNSPRKRVVPAALPPRGFLGDDMPRCA